MFTRDELRHVAGTCFLVDAGANLLFVELTEVVPFLAFPCSRRFTRFCAYFLMLTVRFLLCFPRASWMLTVAELTKLRRLLASGKVVETLSVGAIFAFRSWNMKAF